MKGAQIITIIIIIISYYFACLAAIFPTDFSENSDVSLPPIDVRVECSNWTANISFRYDESAADHYDHDHNSKIQQWHYEFHLQYNDDPRREPSAWHTYPKPVKILQDDNNGTGFLIFNLRPNSYFKFRLVARNRFGDSAPAYPTVGDEETRCVSSPKEPDENPTDVRTISENVSQNSLVICWKAVPQTEWNGPDFHYLVEYHRLDGSREESQTTVVWNRSNCVTIPNQPTYRTYDIRVWSANAVGRASKTPRAVKGHSGEGKPTAAPTNFRLSSNNTLRGNVATFVWNSVHEYAVQGRLKRYKITHWAENDTEKKEDYFEPVLNNLGTIYRLTANKANYATISIENHSGREGPISETISFSMQTGEPTPVNELEAVVRPSGIIVVTWQRPDYFNDIPVGYHVQWCVIRKRSSSSDPAAADGKQTSASSCFQAPKIDANESTEYAILDTAPNAEYSISVAAISATGIGETRTAKVHAYSTADAFLAAAADEGLLKPELRSIRASHHEARIAWVFVSNNEYGEKAGATSSTNDDASKVVAFVKYKRRDGGAFRITRIPFGKQWVLLRGLCPGMIYDAIVVHLIEYEPGRWSRNEFDAHFGTTEPKDDHCVEENLRMRS